MDIINFFVIRKGLLWVLICEQNSIFLAGGKWASKQRRKGRCWVYVRIYRQSCGRRPGPAFGGVLEPSPVGDRAQSERFWAIQEDVRFTFRGIVVVMVCRLKWGCPP